MSKSRAKKQREHLVRNGKMDPSKRRGKNPDFSTHVRQTPTKKDKVQKIETKYSLITQRAY